MTAHQLALIKTILGLAVVIGVFFVKMLYDISLNEAKAELQARNIDKPTIL